MDYLKTYKSFLYSHYLTDGIRVTIGILVPAFVMIYFQMLPVGIVMSIGALCVSVTDMPGPISYRRNEMLICVATIFIVTIYVGLASYSAVATGIILALFCFFFSMLGVYGNRAGAIGIAALLVMVLNFNYLYRGYEIFWNALYILTGGAWYFLFSISLYNLRPYKLVQQAMGDYIQGMADYLETRASFYKTDINYDQAYRELLQKQINVQQKHELVSELVFKTRDFAKDSTHTGRILVMIFIESTDLFDRIMTSYQDYRILHDYFHETEILSEFHQVAFSLKEQLDEIGLALKSGRRSIENKELVEQISKTRRKFQELRAGFLKPENIDGFINLRRILDNIQDIATRLHTLHQYTTFDHRLKEETESALISENFITHQEIRIEKLWDNLSPNSNIFRHSLRVTIAAIIGYLLSILLPLGHSYWILLTIIVILKPAYSLTHQRNKDRLIGTVCGAIIGVLLLYLIDNFILLMVLMVLLMAASNILIKTKYLLSVIVMTAYLLIFFYLLDPKYFVSLLKDRIIDTALGSAIAFVTAFAIVPDWERRTIKSFMISMLQDNRDAFMTIAGYYFPGKMLDENQQLLSRKKTLVSLANLSDAFTRMMSEPKSQQKQIEKIHQFVVLNHRLTAHISTLSHYYKSGMTISREVDLEPVISNTQKNLSNAISFLEKKTVEKNHEETLNLLTGLYEEVNILLERRREELRAGQLETDTKKTLSELKSIIDQFKFIYTIAAELEKITVTLELE